MRTASQGNRLVVGESGIVFEVPDAVASGLVGNKTARYVDEAVSVQAAPPRHAPVAQQPEPASEPVPAEPKRRGRPPKAATVVDDTSGQ